MESPVKNWRTLPLGEQRRLQWCRTRREWATYEVSPCYADQSVRHEALLLKPKEGQHDICLT